MARAGQVLAPAILLLLAVQWPLRDLVGAGATLANDWAQCLFALYVALAVPHAALRGQHVVARPDVAASPRGRRGWRGVGAPVGLLAWSLFVLVMAWPTVWLSLRGLERFPETGHAGYALIKLALLLLAAGLALQAAAQLFAAWRAHRRGGIA